MLTIVFPRWLTLMRSLRHSATLFDRYFYIKIRCLSFLGLFGVVFIVSWHIKIKLKIALIMNPNRLGD